MNAEKAVGASLAFGASVREVVHCADPEEVHKARLDLINFKRRMRRKRNAAERLKKEAAYREKNRERIREKYRLWRAKNRTKIRAYMKAYRAARRNARG